jgi:hypothetical protein
LAISTSAEALRSVASAVSVASRLTPICVWLPVGEPLTNVQVTPFSVIVEFAAGWPEKLIEPVALTAAPVTGAPNSPVSHQPVPWTSSGMSMLPSSVTRPRYGSWALRPRPSSGSSPSGCSAERSQDLKSSER